MLLNRVLPRAYCNAATRSKSALTTPRSEIKMAAILSRGLGHHTRWTTKSLLDLPQTISKKSCGLNKLQHNQSKLNFYTQRTLAVSAVHNFDPNQASNGQSLSNSKVVASKWNGLSSHNIVMLGLNPLLGGIKNFDPLLGGLQRRNFSISAIHNSSEASKTDLASKATESTGGAGGVASAASGGETEASKELILDFLPEKPTPIDPTVMLGEPTLESLGLASWWPTGRLQYMMEQLHVGLGLDWYIAIGLTALSLRIVSFPLVVMAQRNIANMNNNAPGMAKIQEKMTEARQRGDTLETAQYGQELQNFMKKKGINPVKNMFPILIQLPIFMSMFLGLRGMANLPVPSMETGGALWFENLAMADPFYLLPILTSASLFLQIKMGVDGNRLDAMGPMGRVFFTIFPFVLVPMTMNFPCAVTFYWFATNTISCVQASVLRMPAVRKQLNIPELIKPDPKTNPQAKKGFRQSMRESLDNFKVQSDIADRRAMDDQAFREAGTVKATKTYAYDPTKPVAFKPRK